MNARICTVVFGSMPFTMLWEVAAYAGAHAAGAAQPPTWLIAAGAAPQVIAAGMVVAILADRANRQPKADETAPPRYGDIPTQVDRALSARRRKELAR